MNETEEYLLELLDIQHKLKKLKEQRPDKFYEFKGIVNTVYAIKTGKGIEGILNNTDK